MATMYAQATYKANVAGSPVSGVFTAIPNNAVTRVNFTGFGAVYEPGAATQKIRLVKYVAGDLGSMGTVVTSSNTTLADTDILKISYNLANGNLVVSKNGNSLLTATDTALIAANPSCGGLFGIGSGTSDSQNWTNFIIG